MSPHAETMNAQLLSSSKLLAHVYNVQCNRVDIQLQGLEEKLSAFDPEKVYSVIRKDLESKYKVAAEYYTELTITRKELEDEKKVDMEKEEKYKADLRRRLDLVVNTLRSDFSSYIEEYNKLLDALFLLRTNICSKGELEELAEKVEKYLATAEQVYKEEFEKIERIYELLDDEGVRLNRFIDHH